MPTFQFNRIRDGFQKDWKGMKFGKRGFPLDTFQYCTGIMRLISSASASRQEMFTYRKKTTQFHHMELYQAVKSLLMKLTGLATQRGKMR
jgi:hypothetical protein